MRFRWTRQLIQILMMNFQKHSCLYNSSEKDYLSVKMRKTAWNDILNEMRVLDERLTIEDVKKKAQHLRSQYGREHRQLLEHSKKSSEPYQPKLWCFEQLEYLGNYIKPRPQQNFIKNEFYADNSIGDSTEYAYDAGSASDSSIQRTEGNFINKKKNCCKHPKKFSWLGQLVVDQMDEIDAEDQQTVAWKIQYFLRTQIVKSEKRKEMNEQILYKNHASQSVVIENLTEEEFHCLNEAKLETH